MEMEPLNLLINFVFQGGRELRQEVLQEAHHSEEGCSYLYYFKVSYLSTS